MYFGVHLILIIFLIYFAGLANYLESDDRREEQKLSSGPATLFDFLGDQLKGPGKKAKDVYQDEEEDYQVYCFISQGHC